MNHGAFPPRRAGAAALAGIALALAFPDTEVWPLAWVALVPLLLAIRGSKAPAAAAYGWFGGFVFFLATLYWIPATISNFTRIAWPVAVGLWVLLAAVAAYSFALFAALVQWLAGRGRSPLVTAPLVWVVVEWMRTFVIAEFPWNSLGYSQMEETALVQIADVASVYGISAAIVLTNVAIAEAWVRRRRGRAESAAGGAPEHVGVRPRIGTAGCVAVALAAPALLLGYGTLRLRALDAQPFAGALRVAVVQGNVAQNQKWDEALQDEILQKYLRLSEQAADAGARLIVWPEAAVPFYFRYDSRSLALLDLARRRHVDMLVGAPGYEASDGGEPQSYNQAWLVTADGDVQGPYDKIQLVPFGEYIPLHGLLGMVDIAVQSVGEFGRGDRYTLFETAPWQPPLPADAAGAGGGAGGASGPTPAIDPDGGRELGRPARFATLICYEAIFPALTRRFAAEGAEFLVNISNDAWYGETSAPHQHLSMAALRTVENRMPMVRSTNTGISAFITADGRMGSTTPLFEEDVAVETILTRPTWSFYRAYGDVFVYVCLAAVAALALRPGRRTAL